MNWLEQYYEKHHGMMPPIESEEYKKAARLGMIKLGVALVLGGVVAIAIHPAVGAAVFFLPLMTIRRSG